MRSKGEAAVEVIELVSCKDGYAAFTGKHLAATDEGYQHWAVSSLADTSKTIFHLCGCHAWACGWNKRGRKIIHISRWRVTLIRDLALEAWASQGAFSLLRRKIQASPKIHLRKIGKQSPSGLARPGAREVAPEAGAGPSGDLSNEAVAEQQRLRIREALRSGRPNLLDEAGLDGMEVPALDEAGAGLPGSGRIPDKIQKLRRSRDRKTNNVNQALAGLAKQKEANPQQENFLHEISSDSSGGGRSKRKRRKEKQSRKRKRASSASRSSSSSSVLGGRAHARQK